MVSELSMWRTQTSSMGPALRRLKSMELTRAAPGMSSLENGWEAVTGFGLWPGCRISSSADSTFCRNIPPASAPVSLWLTYRRSGKR